MTDLKDAERMGREAFEAGKPRAPAMNKAFLDKHISGKPITGTDSPNLMKAFVDGWDEANLSADVPGWTDEENEAMQRARWRDRALRHKENKS